MFLVVFKSEKLLGCNIGVSRLIFLKQVFYKFVNNSAFCDNRLKYCIINAKQNLKKK